MTGLLVSIHHFRPPTYVAVDGHLPTGWGMIHTPGGKKHHAYKETPGYPTTVPTAASAMAHYVPFFLTTKFGGVHYPAN